MAERRMFAKSIIDSDDFLDMPASAQCLYFHLSMRADDDGFVNSPKRIQKVVNCADDDFKLLIYKHFIIPFDCGVCVIKHWKIHNYIQNDRKKDTNYTELLAQLEVKKNNSYTLKNTPDIPCIQNVSIVDAQYSIGKERVSIEKDNRTAYAENVKMTTEEYDKLIAQYTKTVVDEKIVDLSLWKLSKGKQTKSDYATLLVWLRKDVKQQPKNVADRILRIPRDEDVI